MKRILAVTSVLLLLLTLLAVPAAGSGGTFTDDDTSIFEPDIEWLVLQEITKGCNAEGTLFCPDDPVTRGQMAAFLVRALGYTDNGGGNLFTDDDTSIFEADIDKLATAGVTKGCNAEGTLFCPDDPVTRGQMAAFLVRALGYTDNGGGNLFTDDDTSIFETAIDMLATAGVTKGCNAEGTLFCPDDPVTRGQMAAFLHRSVGGMTPTTTTAATPPPPPPPTSTTTTTSPPTASLDQSGFAIYNDDGTESGATRRGDIDQYWWAPANTPVLTRFLVTETGGGAAALTVRLQYQVRTSNAGYGPWTDVNASSSNVRSIASLNVTEGGTTTQRVGSGTFAAGRIDDVDGVTATAVSLSGNDETEFLFAVEFRTPDLAEGNSVHLRLVESDGTPLDAYSQVPTYTIATDYANTFDGQTDEDDVTTTNLANSGDAPDQVMQPDGATSNIIKYDTDVRAHGTSSVRVDNTNTLNGTTRLRWNDRYLNQVYLRFYVRLDALPSSTLTILQIDDEPGHQMFRMQVNNGGQVTVRAGGGGATTYTTTNSLSTDGSWDRIEVALIPEYGGASNGVIDLRLFLGSDVENTLNLPTEQAIFDVTDSVTFGGETVFDQFDVPYVRAGFPGFHIDELGIRNTDWWGPTP